MSYFDLLDNNTKSELINNYPIYNLYLYLGGKIITDVNDKINKNAYDIINSNKSKSDMIQLFTFTNNIEIVKYLLNNNKISNNKIFNCILLSIKNDNRDILNLFTIDKYIIEKLVTNNRLNDIKYINNENKYTNIIYGKAKLYHKEDIIRYSIDMGATVDENNKIEVEISNLEDNLLLI